MARQHKVYQKVGKSLGKSRPGRAILRSSHPKKSTIAGTMAAGAAVGGYAFGKMDKGLRGAALGGAALGAGVIGLQHAVNRRDPRIKAMQHGAGVHDAFRTSAAHHSNPARAVHSKLKEKYPLPKRYSPSRYPNG